ncbi:outer membrane beta-barrel protein [Fibrella sp. WM1]|uniref:outer membrane beta-barrel protein n=1 Tax=Fibrella musci TaxID=3242485 RepID=UPI003520A719
MRTLFTLCCFMAIAQKALAMPADSLIIRFGSSSRVAIYAPTKEELKKITQYDLNQIVREMVSKLDSVPEGQVYAINEQNGKRYLRDTLIVVQKSGGNVTISVKNDEDNGNDSSTDYQRERNSRTRTTRTYSSRSNWKVNTDFHIGLNTWLNGPTDALYNGGSFELSPLGSRYFAISLTQNPSIVRNDHIRISVRYGLQFAWNNFMFQQNVRLEREANNVAFQTYPAQLEKSKLTICNLEIPVVPQFSIYNNSRKRAFSIGFGGFIGYRLDSYTKIKLENNDVIRDHNSYFLNNLQYGLQGNIGVAGLNFFVKYHLTNTFQDNRGPSLRPLSFGITI